ncbi:LacI family DNA-binding transcriptional regulator [Oryzicola mucosus]|nr:LacI family DNA-binding transcriptional regulator [Oryzicola mucosus]
MSGAKMDGSLNKIGPKTNPRISDVARVAGVSTATVSRVLSNPSMVSAKTRDHVLAAVTETGYRINLAARNLRRRQSGGIVVLVPHLSNPFFSQILSGIARVASEAGLNVLVADTREPEGADRQIADYLFNNRADGLIVLDGNLPESMFQPPHNDRDMPPVIFACEWVEGHDEPAVTIDNRHGAALAVEHLIALGHRRIGHIMGPRDNILTRQRADGVRDALSAAGLEADQRWFLDGDFTLASGIAAAPHWLALDERPTAVFCSSDAMACGFMSELNRHGVQVPGDVSVVGFDDIEIAAHFIPALTTIRQPRGAIGEVAAGMLLDLMRGPDKDGKPAEGGSRTLPIELIVRNSTAAPNPSRT